MKRLIVTVLLATAISMTGCADSKKSDTPAASTTNEVDAAASKLKDSAGDGYLLPSESVAKVVAKKWKVDGENIVYDLKTDGTGTKDGEAFTFECGFDEDNNITLAIIPDGKDEKLTYAITTDSTGYGINLKSLDGGEDLRLLQADVEFLDMSDERASDIVGIWSDESGNKYEFRKNGKMKIKGSSGVTEGTYSAVQNEEGTLLLNLVVSGGSLEYEYTLSDDGNTLNLVSPGTETVHSLTKE